jgi:hypothetical protein
MMMMCVLCVLFTRQFGIKCGFGTFSTATARRKFNVRARGLSREKVFGPKRYARRTVDRHPQSNDREMTAFKNFNMLCSFFEENAKK